MKNSVANLLLLAMTAAGLVACADTSDKNVVSQVGSARLTLAELQLHIPMDKTGADSIAFAQRYVDDWIDEQLLFEQGQLSLSNLPDLELQVADYRRRLVAQTYEDQLLVQRIGEVTDDACFQFYETNSESLRLSAPIVQGLYVRLLANSSKLETMRRWLKELSEGRSDCIEEMETYCLQHAVAYENFYEQWIDLSRLGNASPASPAVATLGRKVYEERGEDFISFWLVRDFRLAGDVQPYPYALDAIREQLGHQRRAAFHDKLRRDLREEGLRTGFVKLKTETSAQ